MDTDGGSYRISLIWVEDHLKTFQQMTKQMTFVVIKFLQAQW